MLTLGFSAADIKNLKETMSAIGNMTSNIYRPSMSHYLPDLPDFPAVDLPDFPAVRKILKKEQEIGRLCRNTLKFSSQLSMMPGLHALSSLTRRLSKIAPTPDYRILSLRDTYSTLLGKLQATHLSGRRA